MGEFIEQDSSFVCIYHHQQHRQSLSSDLLDLNIRPGRSQWCMWQNSSQRYAGAPTAYQRRLFRTAIYMSKLTLASLLAMHRNQFGHVASVSPAQRQSDGACQPHPGADAQILRTSSSAAGTKWFCAVSSPTKAAGRFCRSVRRST